MENKLQIFLKFSSKEEKGKAYPIFSWSCFGISKASILFIYTVQMQYSERGYNHHQCKSWSTPITNRTLKSQTSYYIWTFPTFCFVFFLFFEEGSTWPIQLKTNDLTLVSKQAGCRWYNAQELQFNLPSQKTSVFHLKTNHNIQREPSLDSHTYPSNSKTL